MKKIYLFLFPLFLLLLSFDVSAESLSNVQIAYGYTRNNSHTWSGYSTTLSHNFGTTDSTIGYIDTFNVITRLDSNFQSGNFYTISYNWTNDYTGYTNSFSMINAINEMLYSRLGCSSSNDGSFSSAETCFSSSSLRFEKTSNSSVRGIVTFVPLSNIRRILISVNTSDSTPTGTEMISNSFSLSNFSYSVSSGGTAEIIDNATQNTQDIINNQNQNTQDIISSIDENMNVCASYDRVYNSNNNPYFSNKGYLDSNGNVVNATPSSFQYTDYLHITDDETYFITRTNNQNIALSYCLYTDTKTLISCSTYGSSSSISFTANQDGYVRFTYDTRYQYTFRGNYCVNGFDNTNDEMILNGFNSIGNEINNSNQLVIDSAKVCKDLNNNKIEIDNKYLSSDGRPNVNNLFAISPYYYIKNSTLELNTTNRQGSYNCFYNEQKQLISCFNNSTSSPGPIEIPENAVYFRYTIYKPANPPQPLFNLCTNGNQALNDNINDLNDSINNSNVDSDTGTGFFDNFTDEDFGLSQIITIPLSTIQSLTSETCVPLQLPVPFTNSNITLPCMTQVYETRLPSIYNLWKIVSFGIIAYLISIDIFHIVKGFKDPESDKVEVLDL